MEKKYFKIKNQLLNACIDFVEIKSKNIAKSIASNKNDLFSETKSSAGDKHETGRAMIQLEMEKSGQQLAEVNSMKAILDKITIDKPSGIICLGSVIITNKANYYLAISAGKLTIDLVDFFVVSTNSPIGKQLLGKKVSGIIPFNSSEILKIY